MLDTIFADLVRHLDLRCEEAQLKKNHGVLEAVEGIFELQSIAKDLEGMAALRSSTAAGRRRLDVCMTW